LKLLNLFSLLLLIISNSVSGQIVTPSLDASVLSLMPATAGWRDKTNFNGSFESFTETDLEGNESKISDVSYMVSSKLLYNVYQESYSSTTSVNKKYSTLFSNLNEKSKNEKTKFNVAVGFGQPLPGNAHRFFLGFSYSSGRIDEEKSLTTYQWTCTKTVTYYGHTYCSSGTYNAVEGESNTINIKESGLGLGFSYNVWQLLYVSYGLQKTSTTDGEVFLSNGNVRYLGNTWIDKFYGFSIKNTKPGVPKFRLEWSFIQSPSAVNESSGSTSSTTVKKNEHDRYEVLIRNMEFSPTNLNNWVFFLHLKQNKIFRKLITSLGTIDDMTDEQISSGFYWSYPGKASLSIGIRYIDSKRYLNTKEGSVLSTKYQVASGRGNRLSIDYSF